jgi:hypothetical protein
MKIKIEFDLTPEEAKEFFVPTEKQAEFSIMLYEAYIDALNAQVLKHVDPHNFLGIRKNK